MIYLIVGHSGSGKSTIANALSNIGIKKIITYTTRAIRPSETNGIDYNFISLDEFKKLEKNNKFIGTTKYVDNYYSTLKDDLDKNYNDKSDCVIVVDKKGVFAIKKEYPNSVCIYLECSKEVLKDRMMMRNDDLEVIQKRLENLEDLSSISGETVNANKDIDSVYEDVVTIIKNTRKIKHWIRYKILT